MTDLSEEVLHISREPHTLEQVLHNHASNVNLGLPEDFQTMQRSPSLRVRRLSTGQMEKKSGFMKKKKSVPSLVLTVRTVFGNRDDYD